jgi:hypothetical protein
MRNGYKIFVRKLERKRPLGRCRHRWEDVRMDLRETEWECMKWMHLAQDRDQWGAPVNKVMDLWVP